MYLTIQGIVLRVTDYNDKDALLTMLTRRHGRLTVKARGLRRKNSPLIAPCQLLAYGEFTLFEYRGQYTINEAQSIELFTPLRRDLTKLSLGTYFAQVSEVLSQEDMPNPELQSLLLKRTLIAGGTPEEPTVYLPQFDSAEREVAQRLMELLRQGGGIQGAAEAAVKGDTSQLVGMMQRLMNTPEGGELVERISRQARQSGLTD